MSEEKKITLEAPIPHGEEDCHQNDHQNLSPTYDDGHYVAAGPDLAEKKKLRHADDNGKDCIVSEKNPELQNFFDTPQNQKGPGVQ